jgi:hypothetical protein
LNILIGCDVDPALPGLLQTAPSGDIWKPLNLIPQLLQFVPALPPITWLIRCDDSVRFCTGDFASGYTLKKDLWQQLLNSGHEIGWHMHLLSFSAGATGFDFDPDPAWLTAAYEALSQHVAVRATRIGWDYGSNTLFRRLDGLGIWVDFSALPGNIAWFRAGRKTLVADWLRAPTEPYRPSAHDYQGGGRPSLRMLEIPITQFRTSHLEKIKRIGWRLRHGCTALRDLGRKTRMLTQRWYSLPPKGSSTWAFYFHPGDLTPTGINNLARNIDLLRSVPNVEFVTASALAREHMMSTDVSAGAV